MSLIRPGLAALAKMNPKMAEKAMQRPFYSAVDKAIAEITAKQPKGTGDQYLAMILKTKGVKPAEVKDRGLDVALKGKGKVSGEELQKLADENPPPQVTGKKLEEYQNEYGEPAGDVFYGLSEPKFAEYRTPGGENYREVLFHIPTQKTKPVKPKTLDELQREGYSIADFEYDKYANQASYKVIGPDGNWVSQRSGAPVSTPEQALINYGIDSASTALKDADKSKTFFSKHFGGEGKNLLAHARVQDMKGPSGEKIMVIDEIQSDWHQQGRKKGYMDQYQSKIKQVTGETITVSDFIKKYGDEAKEWVSSKNSINEDLNLPPLNELSQINVLYHDGIPKIVSESSKMPLDKQLQIHKKAVEKMQREEEMLHMQNQQNKAPDAPFKKNWHELVMKRLVDDAAKGGYDRVIITPGSEQTMRYGKANLLEGMQGFYDKMLPSYIKNQYGVEVGQHPLKLRDFEVVRENRGEGFAVIRPGGGTVAKYPTMEEAQAAADQMSNVNYHSFDITPEMRESITTQGQPLYQLAPVAGAIGAGMMATDEEPTEYKKGGKVKKPVSLDAMRLAVMSK